MLGLSRGRHGGWRIKGAIGQLLFKFHDRELEVIFEIRQIVTQLFTGDLVVLPPNLLEHTDILLPLLDVLAGAKLGPHKA